MSYRRLPGRRFAHGTASAGLGVARRQTCPLCNSIGTALPTPKASPKLMQTPSLLLSAKLALAARSARRARPPRFYPDFLFIPLGDPYPAWTGNRGHSFSGRISRARRGLLHLAFKMLIYILKPFASAFLFFFFF